MYHPLRLRGGMRPPPTSPSALRILPHLRRRHPPWRSWTRRRRTFYRRGACATVRCFYVAAFLPASETATRQGHGRLEAAQSSAQQTKALPRETQKIAATVPSAWLRARRLTIRASSPNCGGAWACKSWRCSTQRRLVKHLSLTRRTAMGRIPPVRAPQPPATLSARQIHRPPSLQGTITADRLRPLHRPRQPPLPPREDHAQYKQRRERTHPPSKASWRAS